MVGHVRQLRITVLIISWNNLNCEGKMSEEKYNESVMDDILEEATNYIIYVIAAAKCNVSNQTDPKETIWLLLWLQGGLLKREPNPI